MKDNTGARGRIIALLEKGVHEGIYPGTVLLVAKGGQKVFFQEAGHLSVVPEKVAMKKETIFDLASLTKPLATGLALMKLLDEGRVGLDEPLGDILGESPLKDKARLTPRLLLSHSAGLADWKPFYLKLVDYEPEERKRVLRDWIIQEPLAYSPGRGALYSDLGFMVLEWVIEERAGEAMAQHLNRHFYGPIGLRRTFLSQNASPANYSKEEFAATEDCPWRKRIMQGEVHDENAYALGGHSGHAGLFGTAEEVFQIVNLLREHYLEKRSDYLKPETMSGFFKRQSIVDECDWALGWDTPSKENSSSGKHFSQNSVGHTGFTGTSLWLDLEKDVVVIFLTNRVHPTRNNEGIKAFRPKLHDMVMEELGVV